MKAAVPHTAKTGFSQRLSANRGIVERRRLKYMQQRTQPAAALRTDIANRVYNPMFGQICLGQVNNEDLLADWCQLQSSNISASAEQQESILLMNRA